jgi:hypothetical protein
MSGEKRAVKYFLEVGSEERGAGSEEPEVRSQSERAYGGARREYSLILRLPSARRPQQ